MESTESTSRRLRGFFKRIAAPKSQNDSHPRHPEVSKRSRISRLLRRKSKGKQDDGGSSPLRVEPAETIPSSTTVVSGNGPNNINGNGTTRSQDDVAQRILSSEEGTGDNATTNSDSGHSSGQDSLSVDQKIAKESTCQEEVTQEVEVGVDHTASTTQTEEQVIADPQVLLLDNLLATLQTAANSVPYALSLRELLNTLKHANPAHDPRILLNTLSTFIVEKSSNARCEPIKAVFRKQGLSCAKKYADNILATSSSLSNTRVFWTDASVREPLKVKDGQGYKLCGGIAVAERVGAHWTVRPAHVVGLRESQSVEGLAVLSALQTALRDAPAGGSVLVFSDNDGNLSWLEKVLKQCSALIDAAWEFHNTGDHGRLASVIQVYGLSKAAQYPGDGILATIEMRILAAYSALIKAGVAVEFRWVPGHSGVLGNEVADLWAGNACRWFSKASPRDKDVLVLPLPTVDYDDPWDGTGGRPTEKAAKRTLDQWRLTSQQQTPTRDQATRMLEELKHLQWRIPRPRELEMLEKASPKPGKPRWKKTDSIAQKPKVPNVTPKPEEPREKEIETTDEQAHGLPVLFFQQLYGQCTEQGDLLLRLLPDCVALPFRRCPSSLHATTESAGVTRCSRCGLTGHLARRCTLKRPDLKCTACGRPGHLEERCFSLHPEFKKCRACRTVGHSVAECPTKKPRPLACAACGKIGHVEACCYTRRNMKGTRRQAPLALCCENDGGKEGRGPQVVVSRPDAASSCTPFWLRLKPFMVASALALIAGQMGQSLGASKQLLFFLVFSSVFNSI